MLKEQESVWSKTDEAKFWMEVGCNNLKYKVKRAVLMSIPWRVKWLFMNPEDRTDVIGYGATARKVLRAIADKSYDEPWNRWMYDVDAGSLVDEITDRLWVSYDKAFKIIMNGF